VASEHGPAERDPAEWETTGTGTTPAGATGPRAAAASGNEGGPRDPAADPDDLVDSDDVPNPERATGPDGAQDPSAVPADREDGRHGTGRRRRRAGRRRVVVPAVTTVVIGAAVAGVVTWHSGHGTAATAATTAPAAVTTVVRRTDLSNAQTLTGTLGYGPAMPVRGTGSGTVTWLPSGGTSVTRGHALLRVDDRPVPLFYGGTPLYRSLSTVGLVGRDVRVVADNLTALGYDIGTQPAPGTQVTPSSPPDAEDGPGPSATTGSPAPQTGTPAGNGGQDSGEPSPDTGSGPTNAPAPRPTRLGKDEAVLTPSLVAALTRWQEHEGLPATGHLSPGDIEVRPGAVRVNTVSAQVGDPVAGDLMTVTSTRKDVSVPVAADSLGSLHAGGDATVRLPDGTTVKGTVATVGTIAQAGGDGGNGDTSGSPQLTVTVVLADTSGVSRFSTASVQVSFASQTHHHVLAAPVTALLALSGGGYALQTPDGRLLPVTTGMFAEGLVEVSGQGLSAGMRVVTAS
jgi:hypothetical protein